MEGQWRISHYMQAWQKRARGHFNLPQSLSSIALPTRGSSRDVTNDAVVVGDKDETVCPF